MKYDDASWHSDGTFPDDSPPEYGGTHIALFMKWCFMQGWAGALHLESEPEDTQSVIDGTLSATEFLFKHCDGVLGDEDLNGEGNAFAAEYYGDEGLYPGDYAEHFGDLMYEAPESAHDFAKFSSMLESRRQSGILTTATEAAGTKKNPGGNFGTKSVAGKMHDMSSRGMMWFGAVLTIGAAALVWSPIRTHLAVESCTEAGGSFNHYDGKCEPEGRYPKDFEDAEPRFGLAGAMALLGISLTAVAGYRQRKNRRISAEL